MAHRTSPVCDGLRRYDVFQTRSSWHIIPSPVSTRPTRTQWLVSDFRSSRCGRVWWFTGSVRCNLTPDSLDRMSLNLHASHRSRAPRLIPMIFEWLGAINTIPTSPFNTFNTQDLSNNSNTLEQHSQLIEASQVPQMEQEIVVCALI
jgi:hypothetical protein